MNEGNNWLVKLIWMLIGAVIAINLVLALLDMLLGFITSHWLSLCIMATLVVGVVILVRYLKSKQNRW